MANDDPAAPAATQAPSGGRPYDGRAEARRLLRTARSGTLATLAPTGPFASLVSLATLPDGSPLTVVSQLAAHTRHLASDPRCSVLIAGGGKGDPLAHPRLTLVGRAVQATAKERAPWRARFLSRHPQAELYVDFADFSFWRVAIEAAHLNGGFARAAAFDAAELLTDLAGAEPLIAAEEGAILHLNADHRDALRRYATLLAAAADGDWRVVGLDPDGIDLACRDRTARVDHLKRVTTPGDLRRVLVEMDEEARTRARRLDAQDWCAAPGAASSEVGNWDAFPA